MARYDSGPIVALADWLLTVAALVQVGWTLIGLVAGYIASMVLGSSFAVITIVVGGLAGFIAGGSAALRRKVDAQMMLALVQIESNTRRGVSQPGLIAAGSNAEDEGPAEFELPTEATQTPSREPSALNARYNWTLSKARPQYSQWLSARDGQSGLDFMQALRSLIPPSWKGPRAASAILEYFPKASGLKDLDDLLQEVASRK